MAPAGLTVITGPHTHCSCLLRCQSQSLVLWPGPAGQCPVPAASTTLSPSRPALDSHTSIFIYNHSFHFFIITLLITSHSPSCQAYTVSTQCNIIDVSVARGDGGKGWCWHLDTDNGCLWSRPLDTVPLTAGYRVTHQTQSSILRFRDASSEHYKCMTADITINNLFVCVMGYNLCHNRMLQI